MIDLSGAYALEDLISGADSNGKRVIVWNASLQIKKVLEKIDFIKSNVEGYYKETVELVTSNIIEYFNLEK